MSPIQKTDPRLKAVAKVMGWDLSEATRVFAALREEEGRREYYYANIDSRPGQSQIDWFLNFYELSEAEGEAYARYVRDTLAGTCKTVADEQLCAAWGIHAEEMGGFLSARVRKQHIPFPWKVQ